MAKRIALARNPLQENLLGGMIDEIPAIFGKTFEPEHDGPRLTSQQKRVEALMGDGGWRTLPAIVAEMKKLYRVQCGEASVSARLRDMRRGGWVIERQRTAPNSGLWAYRATNDPRPLTEAEQKIVDAHLAQFAATEQNAPTTAEVEAFYTEGSPAYSTTEVMQ
jgi:hypothetical protein